MRRTIFLALVAALLLAPTAKADDPIELLRDCVDDSVLQGNYSDSELREAQKALPTDSDEYSDCRDVLSRALAKDTSSNDSGGDTGGGGGGTSTGGGTGGGGSGSSPDTGTTSGGVPDSTPTPVATPTTPESEQDWQALAQARDRGGEEMEIKGRAISPGEARLAADVGRNSLPGALIAVLALIGAATVSAVVPFLRRRGRSHPQT
jgi:hypothetical protein